MDDILRIFDEDLPRLEKVTADVAKLSMVGAKAIIIIKMLEAVSNVHEHLDVKDRANWISKLRKHLRPSMEDLLDALDEMSETKDA